MKTLYLECKTGAAGDMLLAALYELIPEQTAFLARLNAMGIPGVRYAAETKAYSGIVGTHMHITVSGEEEGHSHAPASGEEQSHAHAYEHVHHHGRSRGEIDAIIDALPGVPDTVKTQAKAVYADIADAEAAVHGRSVDEVHFHELGAMDAVADVVGCCLAMDELHPDEVVCSAISVGGGTVHTAHGMLPVPAPATARLLVDMPCMGGPVEAELCTPTGAALLKRFARSFGELPAMRIGRVGYGFGAKEIGRANCVRALLGESSMRGSANGAVTEISCNVDDMTGEEAGFALEKLLEGGALDAYIVPTQAKKSRPGMLITALCKPEDADAVAALMLTHTSSFGVRRTDHARYMLDRHVEAVPTVYGEIRVKFGEGYGVEKAKAEYEDAARAARECGVPYGDVIRAALKRS